MWPAVGVGVTVVFALLGATWYLSSRLTRIEGRLDRMVTEKACARRLRNVSSEIRKEAGKARTAHEQAHHETSLVQSQPPHPAPPGWPHG